MKPFILALPKLSLPNITVFSTFLKLIEEVGEAKTELKKLKNFEEQNILNLVMLSDKELDNTRNNFKCLLRDTLKEMVDITQTCVSLLFVFEETKEISSHTIKKVLYQHLKEIESEYNVRTLEEFYIIEENGYKYMNLPVINREMNLNDTFDSIIESCGNYAQLMGKYSRLNGETKLQKEITEEEIVEECLKNLIKIAQVSLNLLRFMSEKYNIDLEQIFEEHIQKLKSRGYLD